MTNSNVSGTALIPNQAKILAPTFKTRGIPGVRRNN